MSWLSRNGKRPYWWRGTKPKPLWWHGPTPRPAWARANDYEVVLSGEVDEFRADAAPLTGTLRHFVFDQAHVTGVTLPLDEVALTVGWSEFEDCTFTQRSRPLHPGGSPPQGSFAHRPSVYRRCVFRGVSFRVRTGFSVHVARFEDCVFERCKFTEHFSFCADYLNCRFVGPMKTAVFYGTAPVGEDFCSGRRNTIEGNDFTETDFSSNNVAWRGGVDLAAQRWPAGYEPIVDDEQRS